MTVVAAHEGGVSAIPLEIPESPREPFGVTRLPDQHTPVTDRGLRLAFTAMLAHYQVSERKAERPADRRAIGTQLDKAHAVVRSHKRWTITRDHVEIVGESGSVYRTRPDFCEGAPRATRRGSTTICQGFSRAAVGCYHLIAVELLRLAQELDPPAAALTVAEAAPAPALREIGRAEVDGYALFAVLGHLRVIQTRAQVESVDLSLTPGSRSLCLAIGEHSGVAPATVTGGAYAAIGAAEFGALWQAIRPVGMELGRAEISIAISEGFVGELRLAGEGLDVAVPVGAVPVG